MAIDPLPDLRSGTTAAATFLTSLALCALLACSAISPTHAPSAGPPIKSSAAIWMHPIPAGAGPPPTFYGSVDFLTLFASDAQWRQVSSHVKVFGMYAGWAVAAGSNTAQIIGFLNAHHMSIELEVPSLQATATCGSGVEGFTPYNGPSLHDFTLAYLQKLKAAGADVAYLKVDEPYYFGSVATSDPLASQPPCHWPVAYVAQQVAQFARLVHTVYPNAAVGDTEPISPGFYPTDPLSALTQWHDAYKTANGADFPFYVADIDFGNPGWPPLVKSIETATHARAMQFGIIYIGDPGDTSDAEWASKVISRFETYQGSGGGNPDFVLFQSWLPHPTHCLPETDATTMTGVVKAYIDATTHLGKMTPSSLRSLGTLH